MSKKEKIIYILGAGASKTANLPIQSEILPLIFSIEEERSASEKDEDILKIEVDQDLQGLMNYYAIFDNYRQDLGGFILSNFSSMESSMKYNNILDNAKKIPVCDFLLAEEQKSLLHTAYSIVKEVDISLEDLFTIFDNVQLRHEHFKSYANKEIIEYNRKLKLCIVYALIYTTVKNADATTYEKFAEKLFNKRLASPLKEDPFTVINMNWDSLFEHLINELCKKYNSTISSHSQKMLPDLCFYNNDLDVNNENIPFTCIKAKGIKNIKILKMHGSLNWLGCPKCGRVFTDFNKAIANDEFNEIICPYCSSDTHNAAGTAPKLQCMLITPTFLKSLENLSLKNIWHNAYLDLSEATKLVFIGYSFPDADFEMRCLLKKAVTNDIQIDVVLHESDNPEHYVSKLNKQGFSTADALKLVNKMQLPEKRYKSFFGANLINFTYAGFSDYVESL